MSPSLLKLEISQSSVRCLLAGMLCLLVLIGIPARGIAQQANPRQDADDRTTNWNDAERRFRQQLLRRLPELERIVADKLPHVAQGNPPRINLFKVGNCVVTRSQHGGFDSDSPQGGLVGICLIHGDMNVPASNCIFAVTIGALRLSEQLWPLRNSEATVESIVVIDAEEL